MAGKHVQKKSVSRAQVRAGSRPARSGATGNTYTITPERAGSYTSVRRRRKSPMAVILPVLAVLAAGMIALGGFTVRANRIVSQDTIYPNISVNGIEVGGLTMNEAMEKLADSGADPYRDTSVTVHFPMDKDLTVTASELGLGADLSIPVEAAWAYGRGGSLMDNLKAYRACRKTPVPIVWEAETVMDEKTLRDLVDAAAGEVNVQALDSTARIGDDGITLTKGMDASVVDAEAVFGQVRQAFLDRDFGDITVEFQPTASTGDRQADDEALLRSVYETIHTEPVNAMYDKQTGGVTDSVRGVSFDLDEAMGLWADAAPGAEVFIPYVFTEPEIQALEDALFADLLSEKSTSLSGSSSGRINNIELAARAMNETVINPGETFDYNSCLGERTEARGYMEAGAYSGGKHVTELGGGICQGSSTLYYCAVHADLDITVRYSHYFVVDYLPRGMDATVSWGGPDFRFVNNRDYPIKIRSWVSDGYLTVQIWGTDVDGSYVDVTSETWEDDEFYYAQTYRIVYAADGTQIESYPEAYSNYHKYEVQDEPEEEYYEEDDYVEPEEAYTESGEEYYEPEPTYDEYYYEEDPVATEAPEPMGEDEYATWEEGPEEGW